MSLLEVAILLVAGVGAGVINSVVGSGSLVTFPVLVALGNPLVLANVTNNIGVLPGGISAAWAYRRTFDGQRKRLAILAIPAFVGGALGAVLLILLPPEAFRMIVPALIVLALLLVVLGPAMRRRLAARSLEPRPESRGRIAAAVGATAIYGGYFGAAQGVILLAALMTLMRGGVQVANAYKNVFAATANTAAALVFVLFTPVNWTAALVIAIGATTGGLLGARIGKRLPDIVYQVVIVVVGLAALVYFILS